MPSWSQMLIGETAACHLFMFFLLEFRHLAFDCSAHTRLPIRICTLFIHRNSVTFHAFHVLAAVLRQPSLIIGFHVCCRLVCCYLRSSAEVSLDAVVSQGEIEEPSQASDKAVVPSTSQEPSSSSAGTQHSSTVMEFDFFCWGCVLSGKSILKNELSTLKWHTVNILGHVFRNKLLSHLAIF